MLVAAAVSMHNLSPPAAPTSLMGFRLDPACPFGWGLAGNKSQIV